MLYRDGVYNEDCDDPNLTDVFIRKDRNGPTGHVKLSFEKELMTFTSAPTKEPKRTPLPTF